MTETSTRLKIATFAAQLILLFIKIGKLYCASTPREGGGVGGEGEGNRSIKIIKASQFYRKYRLKTCRSLENPPLNEYGNTGALITRRL